VAGTRELVVIYGGPSAEHEVSCISARRIAAAALGAGAAVTAIGLSHDKRWVDAGSGLDQIEEWDELPSPDTLLDERPGLELPGLAEGLPPDAVIFPLVHGPFGEDGVVQGHFETLGVPYVGAGVLSSAICMDKGIAKSVLHDHGVPVGAWELLGRPDLNDEALEGAAAHLGFPIFVKPANLGSSIGVSKAADAESLRSAVSLAFTFDDFVILEAFIAGRELELALLGNEEVRVSTAGEIQASRDFYDYEDKYILGMAKTIVPAELTPAQVAGAQEVALRAYRALRVEGLARVDLFMVGPDRFVINEVNTMPGFTPISMYPMLWDVGGLPLPALIDELLDLALARHARRRGLRTHR
jgi:D-alanine-D-alanine ligase